MYSYKCEELFDQNTDLKKKKEEFVITSLNNTYNPSILLC